MFTKKVVPLRDVVVAKFDGMLAVTILSTHGEISFTKLMNRIEYLHIGIFIKMHKTENGNGNNNNIANVNNNDKVKYYCE